MQDYKINILNKALTKDGSSTIFSQKYNQHFHSIEDGAIFETLQKHIVPAFEHHKNKKQLNILDICFGLGYNTFTTIYYIIKNKLDIKINIYSPELDNTLVENLVNFDYPKEFDFIKDIIYSVVTSGYYKDDNFTIELYFGDAREYIKKLNKIDIVYQDAFSSDVNKELWTQEYFKDIKNILNTDAIITTYSIATPIRLSMSENSLYIYERVLPNKRKSTLAFNKKQELDGFIDMELKKQRNPNAKPLKDN
jgi:tRNA U34 5-methylaminomethyl-2-thiouridine-forming methyltransferase MnmC